MELKKKLRPENTPFVIRNVNDNVGEIIRASGFNQLLTIEQLISSHQ